MSDVPGNAPEHCPGTSSEDAGKAAACQGCPNQVVCATAPKGPDPDAAAIAQRMASVKHKILVLSGKGGVGKSTFASQLAFALAARGKEVGLLDIDICGPSVPKLLGLEGEEVHQSGAGWSPVYVTDNLGVMSIGFMLPNPDDAVIWRGPRKNGLIKQFLKDVHWGTLDYLVVDTPPGTSDEHISIAQLLRGSGSAGGGADAAVIVTTPQEVSIIDVRKEVSFCRKVGLPVLGVVENMAGLDLGLSALRFVLPGGSSCAASSGAGDATGDGAAAGSASSSSCAVADGAAAAAAGSGPPAAAQDVTQQVLAALEAVLPGGAAALAALRVRADVFVASGGGAARMCQDLGLRLLGRVPLDPLLGQAAEEGRSVFGEEEEEGLDDDGGMDGSGGAGEAEQRRQRLLAARLQQLQAPSAAALHAIVEQIVALLKGDLGAGCASAIAGSGNAAAAPMET